MSSASRSSSIVITAGLAAVALVLAGSFALIVSMKLNVDETFHYPQIKNFLEYKFGLSPALSMLPGYHLTVFAVAWILDVHSIASIRFISLCIGVLSVAVFHVVARHVRQQDAWSKTLQYAFLPLLYPFFFVIYTETLSLLLVLLAIYLTLRARYYVAGLVGILACLVRQDNIAWLGFMFLLIVLDVLRAGPVGAAASGGGRHGRAIAILKAIAVDGAVFLVAFSLFAAFVYVNGGVAIGDVEMQPSSRIHLGNVYLLLFSLFFLFLPMNLANAPKIAALATGHGLVPVCAIGLFLLFLGTFTIDHPYNTEPWAQWFLSNRILTLFQQNLAWKALFFLPILYSIGSLLVTPLCGRKYYLIYPVSVLFLAPHWLVDPRYFLLPLVLFLLFKEDGPPWVRYLTYLLYVGLSAYFFLGIVSYDFFF